MTDSDQRPLAQDAYEQLAERYNAQVDTKPHNAYYERPATLSLLPDVAGRRVLDAGCGPGWYTNWLLDHGAEVVGIDASPAMIALAQQRTGRRAALHTANMDQPLTFLANDSFDLVLSSLVIHYIADLTALFGEFARLLKPGGHFVFSTGHPFGDFVYFKSENYFAVERVTATWHGFGGEPVTVPSIRCPLHILTDALFTNGFVIERLVEPQPTEEFQRADPKGYEFLMKNPGFLCVRARK